MTTRAGGAFFRSAGFLPDAAGAQTRSQFYINRGRIRLQSFTGYDPSGASSNSAAIAAAIAEATARGGGEVEFEGGDFLITSAINRPANVYLVGRGPQATRIKTSGNHRMIQAAGSSGGVINRGGVVGMTLLGSGLANTDCIGVYDAWTNRAICEDVIALATYIGFYASNVWQLKWVNVQPNGSGADQNAIGFYMAEVDPSNQNNAVNASGCVAQGVSLYGWRIINGNGSKLVNCEGLDGVHGFYIGDPTTGTERCRWINFVNCLGDTNSGHNWRFERGAAAAMEQMQMSNCWGGTSTGGHSLYIGGGSQIVVSNFMGVNANKSGIALVSSSRLSVSGGGVYGYDGAAAANPGIALTNSSHCQVTGLHAYSASGTSKGAVESGTSDHNLVLGNYLQGGFTRTGANSRFMRNQGAGGERRGSAQITAATMAVTVTHNCEGGPSIDDVKVTPRSGLGAANEFWVTNMTAATFDINVDAAPGVTITFGWAIDQIGQ
jgi:hypothetical protein